MRRIAVVRFTAVLLALAMVLAACGSEADQPSELPTNDNPGDTPAAAGACLEGEPDCNDTGVITDEPLPLPSDDGGSQDDGGAVVSGGMTVDGGLTVSEALASDATGIIAVQGFLLDDGTGARLCEALAESFPPQCGGTSIAVSNYEEVLDVPLQSEQNTTWTDEWVTFFGEIVDGVFVVDPTVSG